MIQFDQPVTSTLAWIKSPSVDLRTVPFMPIKQCSFVRWKTAFGSRIFECPGLLIFVRIQQISSQRRKPHLRKQFLPMSSPSELPHHKKTKLRCAAISFISNDKISSQFQNVRCVAPPAPPPRKYSCQNNENENDFNKGFFLSITLQSEFRL